MLPVACPAAVEGHTLREAFRAGQCSVMIIVLHPFVKHSEEYIRQHFPTARHTEFADGTKMFQVQ